MIRAKPFYLVAFFPLIVILLSLQSTRNELKTVSPLRLFASVFVVALVSIRSIYKRSLRPSTFPVVILFGLIISITSGVYSLSVIGFLLIGTAVTKVGKGFKKTYQSDYVPEGRREWKQVVSNSGAMVILCLFKLILVGHGEKPVNFFTMHNKFPMTESFLLSSYLHIGILGAIACSAGDTFASELGPVFAKKPPVMITNPWRSVPVGTNGAVTICGLLASVLAGAIQGCIHYIFTVLFCRSDYSYLTLISSQWPLILIAMIAGCIGNVIDSILGATLQFSGVNKATNMIDNEPDGEKIERIAGRPILDNDMVNFISTCITAVVATYVIYPMFI